MKITMLSDSRMAVNWSNTQADSTHCATMAISEEEENTALDLQADAIWIISSTFLVFTMQSGSYEMHFFLY